MFTICLAFVIFAGVMFELQVRSLSDNVKVAFGADLSIIAPLTVKDALRENEMKQYLDKEIQRTQNGELGAVVVDYTFIALPINYLPVVHQGYISNLPRFPSIRNYIYGVQDNLLKVVYSQYYMVTETDSSVSYPKTAEGKPDAIKLMFTDKGNARFTDEENGIEVPKIIKTTEWGEFIGPDNPQENLIQTNESLVALNDAYRNYIDVVISESLRDYGSIDLDTPLDCLVRFYNPYSGNEVDRHYLAKPRALVSKLPGFFFSSYRQTASFSSVIITMESYERIMRDAYGYGNKSGTPSVAPKQKLLIRLKEGAARDEREDVINGLRPFYNSQVCYTINTHTIIDSMSAAVDLLNLFFTVVGTIAMVLCFFILWLSFNANVNENAWEFGVLRAIGLNSKEVVMVYVYESLALVFSAVILGTTIGIVIAVSLTVQMNLFTEMPFVFKFPSTLFFSMFAMSVVVGVLGSAIPARMFLTKSISAILRRQ